MTNDNTQYLSEEKLAELKQELRELREEKIPTIAKRIDEAKQLGDLSENAEYHAAREDMAWAQSRIKELGHILDNAQIITKSGGKHVDLGSQITVEVNGKEKTYTIVGAQEADPLEGRISNESPLGEAFIGKKKGDKVDVQVPAGTQTYKIKDVN